jgi:hypothetical protein
MSWLKSLRLQWDRYAAWALILLGGLVLLVGWLGVSDTVYPAEQLPYILSGGIFGMFLLGIGAMLWLSADLRDEWRKLDRLEDALRSGGRDVVVPSDLLNDGTAVEGERDRLRSVVS